jgi:uncharacterized delta-60 repeat protein
MAPGSPSGEDLSMRRLTTVCVGIAMGVLAVAAPAHATSDGFVLTDFAGWTFSGIAGVARQADGKLVLAGGDTVTRYSPDGALDTSFGTGGQVRRDGGMLSAVAVQPDGRIVVGGSDGNFVISRYRADGSLDTSFGIGGTQTTVFSDWPPAVSSITALAIQRNGKIVAVGSGSVQTIITDTGTFIADARYDANGVEDRSLTGMHQPGPDQSAAAVMIEPDGQIVLAGAGNTPYDGMYGPQRFLIGRLDGEPVNAAPTARVAYSCSSRTCYFNGFGSSDADGTIASYRWTFSDGTSATGAYVRKDFPAYGTHTATLTITDNGGASGTSTESLTLLRLTGSGAMVGGMPRIAASWNGIPGRLYWVYRGTKKVGITTGTSTLDVPPLAPSGVYQYAVCEASGPLCSATEDIRIS